MHNFFIAHPVEQKVKSKVKLIQDRLSSFIPEAKLTNPNNTHVTLTFFPQVNPKQLKKLRQIINDHKKELLKVKLYFDRIDGFPDIKKAQVLYIHLGGEIGKLMTTAESIRNKAHLNGIVFDPKTLIPHLTIARLKTKQNLSNFSELFKLPKVEFNLGELILYQSLYTGPASLYLPIA